MRIYTRRGDDGSTGLLGQSRLRKSDLQFDAMGACDELNAHLGLVLASVEDDLLLTEELLRVQGELFTLGSHLALATGESPDKYKLPPMTAEMVSELEHEIDEADAQLNELKTFILPGGSVAAAHLHIARAVCRRLERLVVTYSQTPADLGGERQIHAKLPDITLSYLNRLSDWLFTMARLVNMEAGIAEKPWTPSS